ncbi:response regulator [Haloferax sp. YSMS24]|uniref:hybrid sensor histidine kinase/response regulator n=1 Tax=Haloferax sp. YSMS24 TaxID=3388425 RepID=UPI00398D34FE
MNDGDATGIRLLHVDDDPHFAELASLNLERRLPGVDVETCERGSQALDRLESERFDCLVSDFQMPEMDGVELLEAVRERSDVPFILFTGHGSEEVASDAIAAGVSDYVQKRPGSDQWVLLANRIRRAVREHRAVAERDESDRRFSTLIEAMPGVAFRTPVDPSWPIEFISDGCAELTGYDSETFESGDLTWEDIVHPDDRGDDWDEITTAVETGEPFDVTYRIQTREGETKWVREQGLGVEENGEVCAVEGYVLDVTEERSRRLELREKETLLDSLFESVPVHLFAKDADARHVRVSSALVDDPESFVGKTDLELHATSSEEHRRQAYEDDRAVLETGDPILDKEEYLSNLDRWNLTSKVPWVDDDGDVVGIIGISRDITERKRHKQEVLAQNERLNEFASIVSHDLRNPLNVAHGNVELARKDHPDDERLDTALDALERLDDIVDDVWSMARQGQNVIDRKRVLLADAVDEAWRTVETADATLSVTDPLGTVHSDRSRLVRLLENLFRNAVEHGSTSSQRSPDDAVEHGSTGNRTPSDDVAERRSAGSQARPDNAVDHDATTVTVRRLEDEVGFVVTDDGPGIPEAERESVFDRGYTTDESGTGYGLAIVADIVDAHGWDVRIGDSSSGGARIEVVTGRGLHPEDGAQSNSTSED